MRIRGVREDKYPTAEYTHVSSPVNGNSCYFHVDTRVMTGMEIPVISTWTHVHDRLPCCGGLITQTSRDRAALINA